ncbi:MAG: hypothetical protein ACOC5T_09535 [Elusimicrobiota bacterium]
MQIINIDGSKTPKELESRWYDKNLKKINPKESEIGAPLFVTKDFGHLYDFLNTIDFKKLRKKVPSATNDVIIDVFNGWIDLTIKVYSKNRR